VQCMEELMKLVRWIGWTRSGAVAIGDEASVWLSRPQLRRLQ
jgi:hypothetical protein